MHRKRVTCELHDSCFRSMMIKTCHSKDGRSGYSFGHSWEEIEWALNYYITQCTGNSSSLGIRELETRCGRESQQSAEGALRPPINEFGDQESWREGAGMRTCPRETKPPGPRLSSPGERERNAVIANRVVIY